MRRSDGFRYQNRNAALSDAVLEEQRPKIIHDLVYRGMPIGVVASKNGVTEDDLRIAIQHWEISTSAINSKLEPKVWLLDKYSYGRQLPKPLRQINRSEFVSMWQHWDWDSLCAIFGVEGSTLRQALHFHCIGSD